MNERTRPEIITDETVLRELEALATKAFQFETPNIVSIAHLLDEFVSSKNFKNPNYQWSVKPEAVPSDGKKLIIKGGRTTCKIRTVIENGSVAIYYLQAELEEKAHWPLTIRVIEKADSIVDVDNLVEDAKEKLSTQEIIAKLREHLLQVAQTQEITLHNFGTILTNFFEENSTLALSLPQPIRVRRINQNIASFDQDLSFSFVRNNKEFIIIIKLYANESFGTLIGYNEVKNREDIPNPIEN